MLLGVSPFSSYSNVKTIMAVVVREQFASEEILFGHPEMRFAPRPAQYTVLALNIEAVGQNCWVLEAYLLGI